MANTYTKINLHIVFAVKNTNSLIPAIFLPRIHAYMGGILKQLGHFPYAIGGIDSHVHLLIEYNINQSVPDLVRDLKSATSRYINQSHLIPYKFEWQAGYGCFSHSQSQTDAVCNYIRRQHEHHKNTTLEQEIRSIYEKFDIDYDERFIIREPTA